MSILVDHLILAISLMGSIMQSQTHASQDGMEDGEDRADRGTFTYTLPLIIPLPSFVSRNRVRNLLIIRMRSCISRQITLAGKIARNDLSVKV
jgi:hypothetical protein